MEEDEEELDAGGGIREEASLLGGEGVRARTSTTFRCFDADDSVAGEEEDAEDVGADADTPLGTAESDDIRVDVFESSLQSEIRVFGLPQEILPLLRTINSTEQMKVDAHKIKRIC